MRLRRRRLLQLIQRDADRALQLRIVPASDGFRIELHFHVGRDAPGGNAIALIEIDGDLPLDVLAAVRALPQVQQARPLKF